MKLKTLPLFILILVFIGCKGTSKTGPTTEERTIDIDAPTSWQGVDTPDGQKVHSLLASGDTLYIGTVGAVFSTTDDGESFNQVGSGLPEGQVHEVLSAGDCLYADVTVEVEYGDGTTDDRKWYFSLL